MLVTVADRFHELLKVELCALVNRRAWAATVHVHDPTRKVAEVGIAEDKGAGDTSGFCGEQPPG